jgi:hypothetical protein
MHGMSSEAFVRGRLKTLRATLDANGAVVDPTLRAAIDRAHAESGMPAGARTVVVFREPASQAELDRLAALAKDRFEVDLPADLVAFYTACNGLWLATETEQSAAELAAETHYEQGVRPIEAISDEIERGLSTETTPDGKLVVLYPRMIPFFDVPDQGWHAVEMSEAGNAHVIAYWHDEGEPMLTEERPRVAEGFGEWLDGWITKGFDPFWQDA